MDTLQFYIYADARLVSILSEEDMKSLQYLPVYTENQDEKDFVEGLGNLLGVNIEVSVADFSEGFPIGAYATTFDKYGYFI